MCVCAYMHTQGAEEMGDNKYIGCCHRTRRAVLTCKNFPLCLPNFQHFHVSCSARGQGGMWQGQEGRRGLLSPCSRPGRGHCEKRWSSQIGEGALVRLGMARHGSAAPAASSARPRQPALPKPGLISHHQRWGLPSQAFLFFPLFFALNFYISPLVLFCLPFPGQP